MKKSILLCILLCGCASPALQTSSDVFYCGEQRIGNSFEAVCVNDPSEYSGTIKLEPTKNDPSKVKVATCREKGLPWVGMSKDDIDGLCWGSPWRKERFALGGYQTETWHYAWGSLTLGANSNKVISYYTDR